MPAPAVIAGAFGLADKIASIIDQTVTDKDLALQIKSKALEASIEFSKSIQTGEHVPGYIKLLYALRDVIIPMLRPAGGAALSAYAVYAAHKGVQIDPVIHGMLAAAFPGWMTSRHFNKESEQRTERIKTQVDADRYLDMD